jgi:hypothetical protein
MHGCSSSPWINEVVPELASQCGTPACVDSTFAHAHHMAQQHTHAPSAVRFWLAFLWGTREEIQLCVSKRANQAGGT